MAEKPRLKKSDEILGSIAADTSRASKRTGAAKPRYGDSSGRGNQERRGKLPDPKPDDIITDEEEIELNEQAMLPTAQSLAEKLFARDEKRRQITSEKFEIPISPASEPAAVTEYSFHPAEKPAVPPSVGFQMQSESEQAPPRENRRRRQPPPPIQDSGHDDFEFEPITGKAPVQNYNGEPERQTPPEPAAPQRPAPRASAPPAAARRPEPKPYAPPEFDVEPPVQEAPPPAAARRPEPKPYAPPEFDAEPPAQEAPPPAAARRPEPVPEPETAEDAAERDRREFLNRLSNQFELQFEEKFEQGTLKPREALRRSVQNRDASPETDSNDRTRPRIPAISRGDEDPNPLRIKPPSASPAFPAVSDSAADSAPPSEEEDFLSYVQRQERERQEKSKISANSTTNPEPHKPDDEPVSDFIARFGQDIKKEEERRSEEFKETLAEKFMRERERYMKELDIKEESPENELPEEQPAQSARRRLDFQIQPEMHIRDGEAPPRPAAGPVTYNRAGAAKSQQYDPDPRATGFSESAPVSAPHSSKKTAEQLIMEYGRASKPVQPTVSQPSKLKFTFATPEEQSRQTRKKEKEKSTLLPAEKWPRRIVLIAMVSALFAIGLLAWPIVKYAQLSRQLSQIDAPSSEPQRAEDTETLNVYNDLTYSGEPAKANSVIFKNAGVSLKNVEVQDYVIIEGVSGSGRIRMEDVSVDNAISVKACGVDSLELHNVRASRVIINNPDAEMTLDVSGATNIDVVEIRTPASVRQLEIDADAFGVETVTLSAAESGASINTRLSGLALRTLTASAENSVISFENGTSAETMSADGSLSLSGSGRVVNLSVGAKIGQGAGDTQDRGNVTILVKGVSISNLNVKSPASLNLSTTVDNVSSSDSILIGGDGSVGVLTLNPKTGSTGRLIVDIAGLNIQNLYSNTQSRINITGSARVNILTAGASTYALGNKVNSLVVNANDVIYENEPDGIITGAGIKPPQSKAENPNLDYSLDGQRPTSSDATGEDFATTCGHSRESGGFLIGDGSMDNPFDVSSPAQLAHVASHLDSHFKQSADIDVSEHSEFAGGFPIIGSVNEAFTGVFDGRGFSISRIRIISSDESVGLFASNKGIIQNVRIASGEINLSASNLSFIGSIAGLNSEGGMIRSCSNGASVTGNQNTYTGGIVGYNFGGRVNDCYNYANISGVDSVGGIVGYNRQSATLAGSYNVGIIDGYGDIGGVAGVNEDATVTNCYFLTESADYGIGLGDGTAIDKTSQELRSPQMAADLAAGNENSLWISGEASTNGYHYPMHKTPSE